MSRYIDRTQRASWTSTAPEPFPAHALRMLRARTGLRPDAARETAPATITVGETALTTEQLEALRAVLGEEHLLTGREARLGRAGGLSYPDLLRRREGTGVAVPDAVALPVDHETVEGVLAVCVRHEIAVVPFGGGTSVVGGVDALRGDKSAVLALDLAALDRLVELDPVSRTATFEAGLLAPEAERLLSQHGLTLGHFPQSYERATIGGFAATRSAGQASSGYGSFSRMVEAVRLATPRGSWRLGVAPESAAGPDLREVALGSEGTLGVITEVTVRVRTVRRSRRYEGYVLDGWDRGLDAVRALAQEGVLGDVTRLSDSDETGVGFAGSGAWRSRGLGAYLRARGVREPCLLVLGWESTSDRGLRAKRAASSRVLRGYGPVRLGTAAGESWRRGRFAGPRQRDALLDAGVCVETLETAAYWSRVPVLRENVRGALTTELTTGDRAPIVMCHISHAYETGASLYFTVLVPRSPDDAQEQWRRAKRAAAEAISVGGGHAGGTITHHHGVGTDHAPYLETEIGGLGIDVLTSVKRALDPTGIMNPGKLLR